MDQKKTDATGVAEAKETVKQEVAIQSENQALANQSDVPMGFEDDDADDMIIPRIKVIQTLSPERKDGTAVEGNIINSLTKEKLNGQVFIPVFKFNNNIDWRDRSDGGGILCIARDGKMGEASGGARILCAQCKRNEFDNTKQGKEAAPKCSKYINFFGFFAGSKLPIILSFSKTNYNEGKKMYSLAKVTMQNMWNYGYTLNEKLMAKNNNEWYIINTAPGGTTSDEDRAYALDLYKNFRNSQSIIYDMDDTSSDTENTPPVDTTKTEY